MSTDPEIPDDLADSMKALHKALTLPKQDTSVFGRCRSTWWEFTWWFDDKVWHRFAPQWLRTKWYVFKWKWHDHVTCRFFPRQRWLTRQLPRTWSDKTGLIPTLLYACITHFVDESGENCFNSTDWEGSGLTEQAAKLREVYNWAKTGRAAFQKSIEDAYPKNLPPIRFVPTDESGDWFKIERDETRSYEELYGEVNRLEAEFEKIDRAHMVTIIELLPFLWT